MYIIGLITARGGSKGLPRKNVLSLAGKPLIAWTIDAARNSGQLARVILSTDNAEIAQVAQEWGAEVPFMRPPELAQDHSDHLSVVEHALDWLKSNENCIPDYVLLLQPTSPLRAADDIAAAVDLARQHNADAVVSVTPVKHHPYIAKRILDNGTMAHFMPVDGLDLRRQALPPAYALNGAIYLNRPESLRRDRAFVPPGTVAYVMPPERSIDIDSGWDLHLVDLLLRHPYDTH